VLFEQPNRPAGKPAAAWPSGVSRVGAAGSSDRREFHMLVGYYCLNVYVRIIIYFIPFETPCDEEHHFSSEQGSRRRDLLWARAAPGPEEFASLESRERDSLVNVPTGILFCLSLADRGIRITCSRSHGPRLSASGCASLLAAKLRYMRTRNHHAPG
jgi:hypothetical protein